MSLIPLSLFLIHSQALVEQIHGDAAVTRAALDLEPFASLKDDPFLLPGALP